MIVSWNSTQECNINCIHCYRDAGAKFTDELNTEEAKRMLKQISEAGFKIMIFSGGEPLLRKDIFELVKEASNLELRSVIGTNGILLTEEVVQKLKEVGLARAGISLDSTDPEKHDWFRGHKGAFEKTLKGIENCKKLGLPFQIHTTVLNFNQHEIEKLTDFAVELGAAGHHIFFLVPTGRGKDIEETTLRAEEYEDIISRILDKQMNVKIELKPTCAPQFMRIAKQKNIPMRFSKGCLAGTSYAIILPTGDVQACAYLPIKAGNIREQSFTDIWKNSDILNSLRTEPLKGTCGSCNYNDVCGGCRARAYYYSDGDYLAEEPWCLLNNA